MSKKNVSKEQLLNVIESWGPSDITTEKLQLWMLDNFEPDEFDIGQGESESVVEAMHIVMNEYELMAQDKCQQDKYQLVISFINSDNGNFMARKSDFLRQCFSD